jgi:hypothetical protein
MEGVSRIGRHAIGADLIRVSPTLDALLCAGVMVAAQALQILGIAEKAAIATMRLDVVDGGGSNLPAISGAHHAVRVQAQVVRPLAIPDRIVPALASCRASPRVRHTFCAEIAARHPCLL